MEDGLELRDLVGIINRHRKLVGYIFCMMIIIALLYNNIVPSIYEANVTMRVKYSRGGNELVGTLSTDDIMKQQIFTYAEIIKSRSVIETVIDKVYAKRATKPTYEDLANAIDAQPVKNTEILNITVQSKSPEEAQKVANTLVEVFNERLLEIVRFEGREARVFLAQRVAEAKNDLDTAEKKLIEYKKTKATISVQSQTSMYLEKQSSLVKQASDNQLTVAASQTRLDKVNKQLASQKPDYIADNPLIQQYKSRLADQEVELVGLRKSLSPNHPKVLALDASIAEIKTKLKSEIAKAVNLESTSSNPVYQTLTQNKIQAEVELAVAKVQASVLERLNGELKKELLLLPATEQGLARLLLEHSIAEGSYSMLTKRLEEARINEMTQLTNVQVVDLAAQPETPIKPRRLVNLAIAALLGLFAGITATFVAEYFYKTIDTKEDVKRYLGIPNIGNIPNYNYQQKKKKVVEPKALPSLGRISIWQIVMDVLGVSGKRGKHSAGSGGRHSRRVTRG